MQTCTHGVAIELGGDVIVRFLHRGVAPGNPPRARPQCGKYLAKILLIVNH
jgi:hypothetical protein